MIQQAIKKVVEQQDLTFTEAKEVISWFSIRPSAFIWE